MPGGRSGGAATALGINYQARVAAWFSAQMLASAGAAVLWDWPSDSTISFVACETTDAVDDLRIENNTGARAYIQVKHRLQASPSTSSPLGETLHQFVRQSAVLSDSDRLIIATSSETSNAILVELPRVLGRIRALGTTSTVAAAVRNTAEARVMEVVVEHLTHYWREQFQHDPGEDDLRGILARVYVSKFDVDDDQSESVTAQLMLRSVLGDPSSSIAVWHLLVSMLTVQATLQAGVSAAALESRFLASGFSLSPAAGFDSDIRRLKELSLATRTRLAGFQSVPGDDGNPVRISRAFVSELADAAMRGSLVVTGEPGSGKSGALSGLLGQLTDSDVIVLSADTLASESLGSLRAELGLQHELVDVLDRWHGEGRGYLFIDALDAGRAAHTQDMLYDLITGIAANAIRWTVIASIRRFDLRYNQAIQRAFRGDGGLVADQYRLDEFAELNHFNVPELSPSELEGLSDVAPRLGAGVAASPTDLRALLANAFCLRLFAELVAADFPEAQFDAIRTRVQLLDAYWANRVLTNPTDGDRRERVLRQVCAIAIASRTLTVTREELLDTQDPAPLGQLLAMRLLSETTDGGVVRRELIGFAHHILFDYAVARLLLRGEVQRIFRVIVEQPDTLLLARPSYQLHFEHLWLSSPSRADYWQAAVLLSSQPQIPAIARIIAPAVAARSAVQISDFNPLLAALRVAEPGSLDCLNHLIGAALEGSIGTSIPVSRREIWAEFVACLAESCNDSLLGPIRALLMEFVSDNAILDTTTFSSIGLASRRFLRWLLDHQSANRHLMHFAIRGVARTFDSGSGESEHLIRELISPARLPSHGFVDMPSLADVVLSIAPSNPDLVRDIYITAFGYEEESREPTVMSAGIVGFTSNRRQDYESSHHYLVKRFPDFLRAHPRAAIQALSNVQSKHSQRFGGEADTFTVDWSGVNVCIRDDHAFWGGDDDGHEPEVALLREFKLWLVDGDEASTQDRFELAVTLLKEIPAPAALWRALLEETAHRSASAVNSVVPLTVSTSALYSTGLSVPIGEFLQAEFARFDDAQRLLVELAIWQHPTDENARANERATRVRDRLLGCLSIDLLSTPAARDRLSQLRQSDSVPPNRRPSFEFGSSDYTENDFLLDHGIDPESPEIVAKLALLRPLEQFNNLHLNSQPSVASVAELKDHCEALLAVLEDGTESIPPELATRMWNTLAQAEVTATRVPSFASLHEEIVTSTQLALVAAAVRMIGQSSADIAAFDSGPSWSDSSGVHAVEGLLNIAYYGMASDETKSLLQTLSVDSPPWVRLCIIRKVRLIQEAEPDLMRAIIDNSLSDASAVIVASAVQASSQVLFNSDPEQLLAVLQDSYRAAEALGERALIARKPAIRSATEMWVRRGDTNARAFVEAVIERTDRAPRESKAICQRLRSAFSNSDTQVRSRAFELAVSLCNATGVAWEAHNAARTDVSKQDELMRPLAQIVDHIASDYYFASGAYSQNEQDTSTEAPDKAEYFAQSVDLVHSLCLIPFPGVIHHLVQTLDYLRDVNPREVFLLVGRTVAGGTGGGYEFDPMAEGLVISIVNRFIAEHRAILLADADCRRALVAILDVFVNAGWSQARHLTYNLESIFR